MGEKNPSAGPVIIITILAERRFPIAAGAERRGCGGRMPTTTTTTTGAFACLHQLPNVLHIFKLFGTHNRSRVYTRPGRVRVVPIVGIIIIHTITSSSSSSVRRGRQLGVATAASRRGVGSYYELSVRGAHGVGRLMHGDTRFTFFGTRFRAILR